MGELLVTVSNVRRWLEHNKVFFEILAATSISVMAVVVSVEANRISQRQTHIMLAENLPRFEFSIDETTKTGIIAERAEPKDLVINNSGGPIAELRGMCVAVFKYRQRNEARVSGESSYDYTPSGGIVDIATTKVFHFELESTGMPKGEIAACTSSHGYQDAGMPPVSTVDWLDKIAVYSQWMATSTDKPIEYLGTDIVVDMTWKDLLGDEHEDSYRLSGRRRMWDSSYNLVGTGNLLLDSGVVVDWTAMGDAERSALRAREVDYFFDEAYVIDRVRNDH